MTNLQEHEIFGVIGEVGFQRLCQAFYEQVPGDDILGPMYPVDDLAGAEERLRSFLIYRFGGPPNYIEQRGHPRLRMRHAPFPVTPEAAERWLQMMEHAIEVSHIDANAGNTLRQFFQHMAQFLINRPV